MEEGEIGRITPLARLLGLILVVNSAMILIIRALEMDRNLLSDPPSLRVME